MQPSIPAKPPNLPPRRSRPVRRIDDFIRPTTPRPARPQAVKPQAAPKVVAPPPRPPVAQTPKPVPVAQPAKSPKSPQQTAQTYINKSTILVIVCAMALGFLAQFQFIGQIVVALYAIAALVFRIPTKTTFTLALLSLGVVPIATTLGRQLIAENFGAYSFLLFVVATLQVCIDLVRETKLLRK